MCGQPIAPVISVLRAAQAVRPSCANIGWNLCHEPHHSPKFAPCVQAAQSRKRKRIRRKPSEVSAAEAHSLVLLWLLSARSKSSQTTRLFDVQRAIAPHPCRSLLHQRLRPPFHTFPLLFGSSSAEHGVLDSQQQHQQLSLPLVAPPFHPQQAYQVDERHREASRPKVLVPT